MVGGDGQPSGEGEETGLRARAVYDYQAGMYVLLCWSGRNWLSSFPLLLLVSYCIHLKMLHTVKRGECYNTVDWTMEWWSSGMVDWIFLFGFLIPL